MNTRYSSSNYEEYKVKCVNEECSEYGSSWMVMCQLELGAMCAIDDEEPYCSECKEYGQYQ